MLFVLSKAIKAEKVVKFVTPVKTRFVTRFHMLDSLLRQRETVDYCYREVAHDRFRDRAPTTLDWTVAAQYHKVLEYPSKVVIRPKALETKMPQTTAKAQPAVTTIQPAPLANDFSSVTAAQTPPPKRIRMAVPRNSPRKADVISRFRSCEK